MKIEALQLFEALSSSWIKKREVYKNKILNVFILCLHVAVSTAITHNPKILVVSKGKGLFLTQLQAQPGLCSTPPRLGSPGSWKRHCERRHWLPWQGREHSVSRPVCKRHLLGGTHFCSRSTGLGQAHRPPPTFTGGLRLCSVPRGHQSPVSSPRDDHL